MTSYKVVDKEDETRQYNHIQTKKLLSIPKFMTLTPENDKINELSKLREKLQTNSGDFI